MKEEQPYIKSTYEILDENGKVIGHGTCACYNPKYKPYTNLPKSEGNSKVG